jgi:hypothetical protein
VALLAPGLVVVEATGSTGSNVRGFLWFIACGTVDVTPFSSGNGSQELMTLVLAVTSILEGAASVLWKSSASVTASGKSWSVLSKSSISRHTSLASSGCSSPTWKLKQQILNFLRLSITSHARTFTIWQFMYRIYHQIQKDAQWAQSYYMNIITLCVIIQMNNFGIAQLFISSFQFTSNNILN